MQAAAAMPHPHHPHFPSVLPCCLAYVVSPPEAWGLGWRRSWQSILAAPALLMHPSPPRSEDARGMGSALAVLANVSQHDGALLAHGTLGGVLV